MDKGIKNIAIIGANKEGLSLLPILLKDKQSRVCLIVDPNKDAMLFKLKELGYRLSPQIGIPASTDINDVRKIQNLHIVINALSDQATEIFLDSAEFKDVEKLGTLSTRLLWSVRQESAPDEAVSVTRGDEQTALLGSLREIVDAVRLTTDRRELLSVILKLATESTRAERGSIMLLSPDDGMLRVEIAKGMDEEVVRKIRVPLGEGVSGRAASEGKPLLVSGKANHGEFLNVRDRSDVKSAMCVPLVVDGAVIGVINVSSSESMHVFTDQDMGFLSSMAALAAEVIQRSNDYERMRIDAAKFTFWKDADAIMSGGAALEVKLGQVAKRLAGIIPGLVVFIYIFDDDRGRLLLKAASTRDGKGVGLLSLRPGEGIEGVSARLKKAVFLVDRADEGGTSLRKAYLSIPMTAQGALVGTLNGQLASSVGMTKYHETFLMDIAAMLAESILSMKRGDREKISARRMFAVDEAGLEMISSKDAKRLAAIIAVTPAAILGAEGSLLRIRHDSTTKYHTAATFGLDEKAVRDYFLPIEKETVMEVLRKKDTVSREFSEEGSPYVRSVLSVPLKVNETIVGVLTLFNKTGDESFYPCAFSKADVDTLIRFRVYAEKALANVIDTLDRSLSAKEAKESQIALLERRFEQEAAKARQSGGMVTLATMSIAWNREPFAGHQAEFEKNFASALIKSVKNLVAGIRLDKDCFAFVLVADEADDARLKRAITHTIFADPSFNRTFSDGMAEVRLGIASYPDRAASFGELFSMASKRNRFDADKDETGTGTDMGHAL
ncbi:MAG: GAF domain-containing protein [Deltaproteobacteria bacterium]|nr:GAF domain-containing protein [Deltaproteobacteria bacterium]